MAERKASESLNRPHVPAGKRRVSESSLVAVGRFQVKIWFSKPGLHS